MKKELFLDTDVLAGAAAPLLLGFLRSQALCFTSVLNAAELLAAADSVLARTAAEEVLGGIQVLGFHQRYARRFGEFAARVPGLPMRHAMVAGVCVENDLPLVSFAAKQYGAYPHLIRIDAEALAGAESWTDVVRAIMPAAR